MLHGTHEDNKHHTHENISLDIYQKWMVIYEFLLLFYEEATLFLMTTVVNTNSHQKKLRIYSLALI